MLGWMASISLIPADGGVDTLVHVRPPSTLRSKCTRHLLGRSVDSVLLPARIVASESFTGLFLIGPRIPSGRRVASLQLRPWSFDVRDMPHQVCGEGPTL